MGENLLVCVCLCMRKVYCTESFGRAMGGAQEEICGCPVNFTGSCGAATTTTTAVERGRIYEKIRQN